MINVLTRIFLWSLLYVGLCLLPLLIVGFGPAPAGRDWAIELGVAFGMVGYVMLALQFFTTGRLRWIAPYFGTDAEIRFHRETGVLALVFVFLHPAILLIADPEYWKYFDPTENFLRAVFLTCASIGLILIIVLSLWRVAAGLTYEWWLLTHGLLACGVLLVGLVHALQVGHYVGEWKNQLAFILFAAAAFGVYSYIRLLKPFRLRRIPWKVQQVQTDCPEVYRLVLEADGHPGLKFRAGQYAWITLGEKYFLAQQHPFSMMSSDRHPTRLEFGIKELGDFTAAINENPAGTRAYVDGPYGAFLTDSQASGSLCIVAGIGITPVLSILNTARELNDPRPFRLIYGNVNREQIPFRKELEELSRHLDLKITHVLQEPPDDWDGPTGMIDDQLIHDHYTQLPADDIECFICGPVPVINLAEKALAELNVPAHRIVSERFDLV